MLKNGVVMRRGSDPHFKVDWTEFDSVNRNIVQTEYVNGDKADLTEEEIDTTIQGPLMKKWATVHTNRHVDRFLKQEQDKMAAEQSDTA